MKSKRNPKLLFSYINNQMSCHDEIRSLLDTDGNTRTDKQDIVNILNEQFFNVFKKTTPNENVQTIEYYTNNSCQVSNTIFDPGHVFEELSKLDKNKSCGSDGVSPVLLNECASSFCIPLSMIFKKSFDSSTLPSAWRHANITPIFKKGKRNIPSNYRPISLTSIICKVMEKIIKKVMVDFLDNGNLINKNQHGFVKFKSCMTNLLESLDVITECINRGFAIDILFIDFLKAFDLVPHPELLRKLEAYGFNGKILNWLKAFLSDRKQRVVLDGISSIWKDVLSGVPQGSVLGPLLFIIFINDLPLGLSVLSKLFADDSKLIGIIRNSKDRNEFQTNINKLLSWTRKWNMDLNLNKCKVMHLGNRNIHQDHFYSFEIDDIVYILENTDSERDLGVILQSNLKWDEHISNMINKA
ncbi:unnamed protein product, partial [Brachionus calyciflorus]